MKKQKKNGRLLLEESGALQPHALRLVAGQSAEGTVRASGVCRARVYALLAESAHDVVGESDAKGYRPGAPNPFQFSGTNVFEGAKRNAKEGSAHQGGSPLNYPHPPPNYPHLPANYPKLPADFPHPHANDPHMTANDPHLPANDPHLPAN